MKSLAMKGKSENRCAHPARNGRWVGAVCRRGLLNRDNGDGLEIIPAWHHAEEGPHGICVAPVKTGHRIMRRGF